MGANILLVAVVDAREATLVDIATFQRLLEGDNPGPATNASRAAIDDGYDSSWGE